MLGILISAALAPQVDLRYMPGVGARTKVEVRTTLDYKVDSEDREKAIHRTVESALRETYVQEITAMGGEGPTGLTLDCKLSFFERSADDGAGNVAANTHRHGKRLLVTRGGGMHDVSIGGIAGTELDEHVGRWLDFMALLPPDGRARKGDEWPAPMAKLSALLIQTKPADRKEGKVIPPEFKDATTAGSIDCTLASVDGDVATIAFTGTITASSSEDEKITVTVTGGELKFDTSAGAPVSLEIAGSIEIERSVVEEEYRKDLMLTYRTRAGTVKIASSRWESSIAFSAAE